ncbi:hypothetical protein FRC04_009661 [Tulasnella sp. 424]|nr:hypothetical protein FRC04_009661 [Tulasnella sp. 424]
MSKEGCWEGGGITVAVIGVSGKDLIVLAGNWFAKGGGKSGELIATLDISVLKGFPGDHNKVYAKSKPFQVKKSDF